MVNIKKKCSLIFKMTRKNLENNIQKTKDNLQSQPLILMRKNNLKLNRMTSLKSGKERRNKIKRAIINNNSSRRHIPRISYQKAKNNKIRSRLFHPIISLGKVLKK